MYVRKIWTWSELFQIGDTVRIFGIGCTQTNPYTKFSTNDPFTRLTKSRFKQWVELREMAPKKPSVFTKFASVFRFPKSFPFRFRSTSSFDSLFNAAGRRTGDQLRVSPRQAPGDVVWSLALSFCFFELYKVRVLMCFVDLRAVGLFMFLLFFFNFVRFCFRSLGVCVFL